MRANVNPAAIIYTDDWVAYKPLREYDHRIINHSAGSYVVGTTHTNTIEGFFGNLKTGMRDAYKKVSPAYLQSYVNEYTWRYNARHEQGAMFEQLLQRASQQSVDPSKRLNESVGVFLVEHASHPIAIVGRANSARVHLFSGERAQEHAVVTKA